MALSTIKLIINLIAVVTACIVPLSCNVGTKKRFLVTHTSLQDSSSKALPLTIENGKMEMGSTRKIKKCFLL